MYVCMYVCIGDALFRHELLQPHDNRSARLENLLGHAVCMYVYMYVCMHEPSHLLIIISVITIRSLAAEKLGLDLMNNFLPMGSLDQGLGLDVLQIMRNIHIFVARYTVGGNQYSVFNC